MVWLLVGDWWFVVHGSWFVVHGSCLVSGEWWLAVGDWRLVVSWCLVVGGLASFAGIVLSPFLAHLGLQPSASFRWQNFVYFSGTSGAPAFAQLNWSPRYVRKVDKTMPENYGQKN